MRYTAKVAVSSKIPKKHSMQSEHLRLLLPLELQPAVGFGLSNNTSPFFPIYRQLSPSSHSQHLKISFYFFSPSFPGSSPSSRPLTFHVARVVSIYLVLFRPSSLNLSSLFLCSTFVTIIFLLCGVVSPIRNPQPGGPDYPFLSGSSPLDLSGMWRPTSSIRYCQHSSQDHVTTQAPPLRQSRDTFGGQSKHHVEFLNVKHGGT